MADALNVQQTYEKAVAIGEAKARMPRAKAFVLAMLAGAFIGFGGMMLLLVKTDASLSPAMSSLLSGLAFSLGLFAVVMAGGELFTGNSLMVLGLAEGRYSLRDLLGSWGVVYIGNAIGSVAVAALLRLAGFDLMGNGAMASTIASVATAKCSLTIQQMLFRGAMCNFLVCLGVWMSFSGHSATDKLAAVALPVTAFVSCGFEHSVANMMLLPLGMMSAADGVGISLLSALTNIAVVTAGNVIGGALLFAGAYRMALATGR